MKNILLICRSIHRRGHIFYHSGFAYHLSSQYWSIVCVPGGHDSNENFISVFTKAHSRLLQKFVFAHSSVTHKQKKKNWGRTNCVKTEKPTIPSGCRISCLHVMWIRMLSMVNLAFWCNPHQATLVSIWPCVNSDLIYTCWAFQSRWLLP
jgi:hypothetical protein